MKRFGWGRVGVTLGALVAGLGVAPMEGTPTADPETTASPTRVRLLAAGVGVVPRSAALPGPGELPMGGRTIYPGHILVAYYGTAGTGALGVLGEDSPDRVTDRLREAARPFGSEDRKVQIVYELIVTIADANAGQDGDYSHDIDRRQVGRYIEAAHRNKALLVLDLQPGRSDFLTVAKRWRWALRDPWVGLALDPEWRMAPGQVPARTVGQVRAREVNRVSRWLEGIAVRRNHPQKIFIVHQFRSDMVSDIDRVRPRQGLAMVQHVDGFGTRAQKLSTYHTVARPDLFRMGFKLFYDEDSGLMPPRAVKRVRPRVRFVSYQ
jgi:hypothetical protein